MEPNLILKLRSSFILKGILVFLFVLYIVVFFLIISIPQNMLFIPADMVKNGANFNQPVEIVPVDSYTISNNGLTIERYTIETPGRYSFELNAPKGATQKISFRVFIYEVDVAINILVFSLVPLGLLVFSLRRGHHDVI
jgi:hypothetical protein